MGFTDIIGEPGGGHRRLKDPRTGNSFLPTLLSHVSSPCNLGHQATVLRATTSPLALHQVAVSFSPNFPIVFLLQRPPEAMAGGR